MNEPNKTQIGGDHYSRMKYQPWDYIADMGFGYLGGNVVHHVVRYYELGERPDIEKAIHYFQKLHSSDEKRQSRGSHRLEHAALGYFLLVNKIRYDSATASALSWLLNHHAVQATAHELQKMLKEHDAGGAA